MTTVDKNAEKAPAKDIEMSDRMSEEDFKKEVLNAGLPLIDGEIDPQDKRPLKVGEQDPKILHPEQAGWESNDGHASQEKVTAAVVKANREELPLLGGKNQ